MWLKTVNLSFLQHTEGLVNLRIQLLCPNATLQWELQGQNKVILTLLELRRHTLYSMDDEPSDVLELGPTRKKNWHLRFIFSSYMLAKER